MGKNKKGKFKGSGAWIPKDLYTSRAFLSLKGFAPQLLILFYGKRDMKQSGGKWICENCHCLTMTYIFLEKIFETYSSNKPWESKKGRKGISAGRVSRAIDDLLAKGFIEIESLGGAFQQDKTIFSLSDNWRFWHEGLVFNERPKDTRKRGFRDPQKKK